MTPTGTPLLSWGWLSHSGDESEHVLLLSARPILDRLRDMRRLDAFAPCQVRDRPRQLEHAMIRPRAQVHLPHGRAEELAAGLVHRTVVAHLGRAHVGVGRSGRRPGHPSRWQTGPIAAPAPLRRGARIAADGSPRRSSLSFWNGTRGTSTWMSMRSSSGPERRFW